MTAAIANENPFGEFKIASHIHLNELERSLCPKCKASRMYFCYTCFCYVEGVPDKVMPYVKLPISVDIIKHPKELDGKSTAVHAALIAPQDVRIYTYPIFPDYQSENKNVLLIFPGPEAKSIQELAQNLRKRKQDSPIEDKNNVKRLRLTINESKIDDTSLQSANSSNAEELASKSISPFDKIIMIDSTWNQVHSISTDQRLKGLPRVELTERTTLYWRKQRNSPNTYLSTIEALYCFVKQYHELFLGPYNKQYDNLLFFFKFFYEMIHRNKSKKKK